MRSKFLTVRKHNLVLIHDGLGDHPLPELSGQTPLEAALTPCMDRLVQAGRSGFLHILAPRRVPGTDTGHLALFGQEANDLAHQRGPMEAAGAGFQLQPGDVAVRFNFALLDEQDIILDRRARRVRDTRRLIERLNQIHLPGVETFFLAGTEHRGVVVLRAGGLEPHLTDSDPRRSGVPARTVHPAQEGSRRASDLLNELIRRARQVLSEPSLQANAILTRDAGSSSGYRCIPDLYGLRVACVSGESTVLGLARLCGFDPVHHESMTANLDTDLDSKVRETIRCLHEYDLVYLHLKGCDIAAHDLAPAAKRDFIERTDQALAQILGRLGLNQLCVVSASDHATFSQSGEHHWSPIPLFVSGDGIPADRTQAYSERVCSQGSLGSVSCRFFMEALFRFIQGADWPAELLDSSVAVR